MTCEFLGCDLTKISDYHYNRMVYRNGYSLAVNAYLEDEDEGWRVRARCFSLDIDELWNEKEHGMFREWLDHALDAFYAAAGSLVNDDPRY